MCDGWLRGVQSVEWIGAERVVLGVCIGSFDHDFLGYELLWD